MTTQGITAMGDPHNTPALDGILTQERERRDINSTLQLWSVLSSLLALIMLLSHKKSLQKISSRARILELKSVKNVKLTSRVHLIRNRKMVWSPFSPKWRGSWSHEQLYACTLLPSEMRRLVWDKCPELSKEHASFTSGYFARTLPTLLGCEYRYFVSNVGHKCRSLCASLAICLNAKIFTLPLQSKQQE
jgi:hypothetical protein